VIGNVRAENFLNLKKFLEILKKKKNGKKKKKIFLGYGGLVEMRRLEKKKFTFLCRKNTDPKTKKKQECLFSMQ
jgi:hypothetical protein